MTDLAELPARAGLVIGLLAFASATWWIARGRDRSFRAAEQGTSRAGVLTAADLGHPLAERATFVLFSSAHCSTCPQVRRVLAGVVGEEAGTHVVEIAAESHMGLVRRHAVHRTPTILLLDATGTVRSRTAGPLTASAARDALARIDDLTPHDIPWSPRA
ncbi:thioredoxin family protein [Actinotalea sp. K2]|uniref:TlpA family protein disulfide reductase n=1 Tax=Actinotalea sp. K2 TaxID=2939438 RepID=UPI002016F17B|nr:thioredoxin family protein [Actinotalea sp. K2]MCL3861826.1 thioredoxin family protein [Actinotalea sp. K2]